MFNKSDIDWFWYDWKVLVKNSKKMWKTIHTTRGGFLSWLNSSRSYAATGIMHDLALQRIPNHRVASRASVISKLGIVRVTVLACINAIARHLKIGSDGYNVSLAIDKASAKVTVNHTTQNPILVVFCIIRDEWSWSYLDKKINPQRTIAKLVQSSMKFKS